MHNTAFCSYSSIINTRDNLSISSKKASLLLPFRTCVTLAQQQLATKKKNKCKNYMKNYFFKYTYVKAKTWFLVLESLTRCLHSRAWPLYRGGHSDFSDFPSINFEKININLKIIIFIQVFPFPYSLTKYWRTLPPGTGCCRSPHNADMDPHH